MSQKSIHQAVYNYVVDYDPDGEDIVKNIFRRQLQIILSPSRNEFDHIFNELFSSFYANKILSQRKIFQKRFGKKSEGIISYIKITARRFLLDEIDRKELSTVVLTDEETGEQLIENLSVETALNIPALIEAKEIVYFAEKFFSEEDLKTLCHIFFKDKLQKNYCLENLSSDAIYKRVERLKKKLGEFVKKYDCSYEGFDIFRREFLMSEICKKRCS
ncbi:hypothetical protein [Persephonella sp.]